MKSEFFIKCEIFLMKAVKIIKSIRNPCKKCLVKASCTKIDYCQEYSYHLTYLKTREITTVLSVFSLIILFLISTFSLGLYQWFQIFRLII